MSYLRSISKDYERGEVTCIFLHNRNTGKKYNLFSIFELVPIEQQSSSLIGDKDTVYMKRESVDDVYTIYVVRLVDLAVDDAIEKYENFEKGFNLKFDILDVSIEVPIALIQEPSNYRSVLIPSSEEKTIGRILPRRNTCQRVWSKLSTDKEWLKKYDKKLLEKLSNISRDHLGYDLSAIPEHIGNAYLCAPNPLLRKWNANLLDKEKDLLFSFHERAGRSIIGGTIVIEEERSKNIGFTITRVITSKEERIELPYFPDGLHERIYDSNGELLEYGYWMWLNFHINMNIEESVVNINFQSEDGIKVYSVPKTSTVSSTTVGEFDLSTARYLRNALNERRFEELESSKEFIFFPKHESTKNRAQSTIRELLNKANKRCMILDPYFGSADLIFALTVQNISFPVRIISSAMFLRTEVEIRTSTKKNKLRKFFDSFVSIFQTSQKRKTCGKQLHEGITQFQKQYPRQKIQCKVLRGKKSPLHDRYIVIDEEVYLLGSSLNEFGSRVTTIIKVPSPKKMIAQAEEWWSNGECLDLEHFLTKQDD